MQTWVGGIVVVFVIFVSLLPVLKVEKNKIIFKLCRLFLYSIWGNKETFGLGAWPPPLCTELGLSSAVSALSGKWAVRV
jgi:hypothetical protein